MTERLNYPRFNLLLWPNINTFSTEEYLQFNFIFGSHCVQGTVGAKGGYKEI